MMTPTLRQAGDQVAHVVVFGLFAAAHPALGLGALAVYELTSLRWKVGPVTIGQWPPGNPLRLFRTWRSSEPGGSWTTLGAHAHPTAEYVDVTPMDRVEDLRLDLAFSFLGIALGSVAQDVWMGVL